MSSGTSFKSFVDFFAAHREPGESSISVVADHGAGGVSGFHPVRAAAVLVAIFVAELVAMAVIEPMWRLGSLERALVDASIMLVLAFPALHWGLVRPLLSTNRRVVAEIKRRHEKDLEVQRGHAMYHELFQNVFDGVFEVSPTGEILRMNGSLVRMLGYPNAEELALAAVSEDGPISESEKKEWARRVELLGEIRNFELALRRRDGATVNVIANFLPVRDQAGQLLFFQGTLSDITDRTRAFETEQRARRSAEVLRVASLTLTESLDLDRVLETLLELLDGIVPWDRADVFFLDADGNATIGVRRERGDEGDYPSQPYPRALLLEVVRSGRPVLISDVRQDRRWPPGEAAASWLGVPVGSRGERQGLYTIYRRGVCSLTAEHRAIAEALAAAVAVAVRNASLYDEVVSSRSRLQGLSRKVVELQEEDRRRIARELHDEAAQALTSMRIGLQLIEQEAGQVPNIIPRCRELREVVAGVLAGLHALATGLRPPSLEQLGLADAVREHLRTVSASSSVAVDFSDSGLAGTRLSAAVEVAVFRIVQEAVTNAVRHSEAKRLWVTLNRRGQTVRAEIRDDGRGFDPDQTAGRLGITGMRERAELLGGCLAVSSSAESGTMIVLEVSNVDTLTDRR